MAWSRVRPTISTVVNIKPLNCSWYFSFLQGNCLHNNHSVMFVVYSMSYFVYKHLIMMIKPLFPGVRYIL